MCNQTKSKKNAYTVLMPKNLLTKEENDKLLQDFVELLKPSADCPLNIDLINYVDFINYVKQNNLMEDINIINDFLNEVALRQNCGYKISWLFNNKKNKDKKITVLIDFYFPPMGFITEEYKTGFKISLNCLDYALGDMAYTLLFRLQKQIKRELSRFNKNLFNKKKDYHPNAFALREFIINLYDRTEPNFISF